MAGSARASTRHTAIQRLNQDYLRLSRDPVPYVTAAPLHSNMFEWHYVIKGPEDSPYKGGYYHGKLVFPKDFPFRPPAIYMITPNGRFACNTRLCLSISDFHPDTWNPAWSVSSILTGLLSFMLESTETMGSIKTTLSAKKQLARSSREFNLKSDVFCELFPDIVKEIKDSISAEELRTPPNAPVTNSESPQETVNDLNGRNISSIFVLVVLSIFAFLVKIVMRFLLEPI